MSAQLNSGIRALHLVIPTPYDLVRTSDVRDDLIAVKVWYSTTANFNPLAGEGTLFSQTNSLSVTITGLEINKVYYVKYALISDIDPTHFTVSRQYSAMTYDENTSIYGYLTNDPTALSTASDGSGGDWSVTQGVFKIYSYSQDVTPTIAPDLTNGPFYSIKPGSAIGGLVATIDNKGVYSATSMTGSSGSVVFRAVYKGLTVEKVWNVYKGVAGQTAPTIQLTTPIKEFIYKDVNQKRSTVASTTITATLKNLTGTPHWGTRAYSRTGQELGAQFGDQQIGFTTSSDGLSITISNDQFSNPLDYNVDLGYVVVRANIGNTVFDEMSIYRICDGSTQIQIEQSNQSHQITSDENGGTDPLNYVGSGTTISVKKGAQTLLVDNTGTDAFAADTWRIININAVGITCDTSANIQPTYIEYDRHSAMTADAAYIDYTIRVQITGSNEGNIYQDFITRQSFSKSKQGVRGNTARSVNLTYDALAFLTDNKTVPATVSPPYMTFTATASNYTGAASYIWYVNPGTGYQQITNNTVGVATGNTFRLNPFPVGETRVVKVVVSEDGLSSFDEQGTVSQLLGSDGITAVIYNDTKPVICDQLNEPEAGQFPFTTTFFVARGNNVLNGNLDYVQFNKVSYTGGSDSTYRIDRTSGLITIDSLNANFAEATFTATVGTLVITKKVSFTKYKDGKTPVKGTDYDDGSSFVVEYSVNALQWHPNYIQGDVYIRANKVAPNGAITYGNPAKYIPEKGVEYFDGKSSYLHIKYSDDVTATTVNGVTTYTANSLTAQNGEVPGDYMGTFTDENPNDPISNTAQTRALYTWVRIKGSEGQKGPRNASGWLYYQASVPAADAPPSPPNVYVSTWSWATGTFSVPTLNGLWTHTPFTPSAGQKAYAVSYYVSESAYGVTPVTVELGTVTTSITFEGLVTFQNLNSKANASDLANKLGVGGAAADINAYRNITQINGGAIETGTINANALVIGDYNQGNSDGKIIISSNNNNIKVYSMNGGTMVPRVIIGNLAG